MKATARLSLLLLLGWALAIAGEKESMQGQKNEPASLPPSEGKPESKERRPASPRSFTPSEKISADSAVSFPIDI